MSKLIEQLDAILPQTQCGLCGFNGCRPYATALVNTQAAINLCPPGGVPGLLAIAQLMNANPEPYLAEMQQKAKSPTRAVIREAECIGCTKCIQACPVDAILGTGKLMHTVIADECTGCELCIEPCPVDCIEMVALEKSPDQAMRNHYRQRFQARQQRLGEDKLFAEKFSSEKSEKNITPTLDDRKAFIQAALLRAKNKKIKS